MKTINHRFMENVFSLAQFNILWFSARPAEAQTRTHSGLEWWIGKEAPSRLFSRRLNFQFSAGSRGRPKSFLTLVVNVRADEINIDWWRKGNFKLNLIFPEGFLINVSKLLQFAEEATNFHKRNRIHYIQFLLSENEKGFVFSGFISAKKGKWKRNVDWRKFSVVFVMIV